MRERENERERDDLSLMMISLSLSLSVVVSVFLSFNAFLVSLCVDVCHVDTCVAHPVVYVCMLCCAGVLNVTDETAMEKVRRHQHRLDLSFSCFSFFSPCHLAFFLSSSVYLCSRDSPCLRTVFVQFIRDVDSVAPLDLVIANAGVSEGTASGGNGSGMGLKEALDALFPVNVHGVFATILPAVECFKNHGRGQVCIMSSLAGSTPLPQMLTYAATKAAIRSYGIALRHVLLKKNIAVSVCAPGFIKTRMTNGLKGLPFLQELQPSCRRIVEGLERNSLIITLPFRLHLLTWAISMYVCVLHLCM
jgi:NAD(P)-dependent dehydrogenase (short-subunit alcohol dehydrogenase family)